MNLEAALYAFLFFLPAGISNMAPVFSSRLPIIRRWRTPLDFGKSWNGHRIFGPNKTWRGLLSGIVMGTLAGLILYGPFFSDDNQIAFLLVCASMSAGALIGDAVESFFKRQRGTSAGDPWFPFDQTDYIIGGLLFTLPFGLLPLWVVVWIFVIYFGLHLLTSYLGYLLKLKDKPI